MGVFFSLANGIGRILWGLISDKIGRKTSLTLMFLLQGTVMLAFYPMGFRVELLYLAATLAGFNFGGNFALFPAATADFFGNRTVGLNYGWVFSSYGVGGIVGPVVAGQFGDYAQRSGEIGAWFTPFLIVGIACFIAAGLAILLRPPVYRQN